MSAPAGRGAVTTDEGKDLRADPAAPPWWGPAGAVALAVVATVVLPRLVVLRVSVIDWDESSYALVAQQWLQGSVPFETVFDHKPIGLYMIFLVFFAVFGDEVWVIRLISIVFVSLTAVVLARLAELEFGRSTLLAGLVAGLYGLLTLANGGLATNTEILANLFVALAAYFVVRGGLERAISVRWALAAGAALGLLFQVNYLAGILVAGIAAFYLGRVALVRPLPLLLGRYFGNGALMLAAFLGVWALLMIPVALFGDLGEYFRMQLAYLSDYDRAIGLQNTVERLYTAGAPYLPFLALTVILAVVAASGRPARAIWPFGESPRDPRLVSWLLLLAFSATAAVATGRLFPHFFLFLLPALVMLAAAFLWLLRGEPRLRNFAALWLILAAPLGLFQHFHHFWAGAVSHVRASRGEPPDAIARVSVALRAELGPGETIYVYDGQPVHYFQTRTVPPTRFAFPALHLWEAYAHGLGFEPHEEMERILAREPRFVITGSDPEDGRFGEASRLLATHLASDYVLLPEHSYRNRSREVRVYRRAEGEPQRP